MLGAQPSRAFRRGRPVKRLVLRAAAVALAIGLAGCATRADLLDQDRRLRGMMREQGRSIAQVKREVERLRADVEEGGHRTSRAPEPVPEHERLGDLERKVQQLESGSKQIGMTLSPEGMSTEEPAADTGSTGETPPAAGETPTTTLPPQQTAALAPPPPPPPPPRRPRPSTRNGSARSPRTRPSRAPWACPSARTT